MTKKSRLTPSEAKQSSAWKQDRMRTVAAGVLAMAGMVAGGTLGSQPTDYNTTAFTLEWLLASVSGIIALGVIIRGFRHDYWGTKRKPAKAAPKKL